MRSSRPPVSGGERPKQEYPANCQPAVFNLGQRPDGAANDDGGNDEQTAGAIFGCGLLAHRSALAYARSSGRLDATAQRQRTKRTLKPSQLTNHSNGVIVFPPWNCVQPVVLRGPKIVLCGEEASCAIRGTGFLFFPRQLICCGGNGNGNRGSLPACSCAGLFRVQVGAQFAPRNSRLTFNRQHELSGDASL